MRGSSCESGLRPFQLWSANQCYLEHVLSEGAGSCPSCHTWPLRPVLLLGSQPGRAIPPTEVQVEAQRGETISLGAPWEGVSHSVPLLSSPGRLQGVGTHLGPSWTGASAQAGTFPDSGGQEDFTCRTRLPGSSTASGT